MIELVKAILLGGLLFASGCASVSRHSGAPLVISSVELDAGFASAGIGGHLFALDHNYAVPTLRWLRNDFTSAWGLYVTAMGPWVAESNDCDDLARGAAWFASFLHHHTFNRPPGTGLAFGEFWYMPDGAVFQGHAINVAICADDEGKLVILFFEPDPGNRMGVVGLTKSEMESCFGVRF